MSTAQSTSLTFLRATSAVIVLAALAFSPLLMAQSPPTIDWSRVQTETLQHYQALLRLDTSDPPGNESIAANYLRQVLEHEGVPVQLFEAEPNRANLVARLKGNDDGPHGRRAGGPQEMVIPTV